MPKSRKHAQSLLPWRHGLFLLGCCSAAPLAMVLPWQMAVMSGFDLAALLFLGTLYSLFRHDAARIRQSARSNDGNREIFLAITAIVSLTLLVAVGAELSAKDKPSVIAVAVILTTLGLAWIFSNVVYAIHYAYLFYAPDDADRDAGGISFSGKSPEPDYWDFAYFAFTLGMTFQTSDTGIDSARIRRVVLFHCIAAFVFNLGILAFTINVLGGG